MPPKTVGPPRKEACIIIIDVGASMGQQMDDGRPTGLDNAKKALQLMIQQKLLFTKQDELGIILLGTEDTENELNQEDPDSYQHVSIFQQLQVPDLRLLESINSIEPSTCRRGDAIDAILVAMQILHARVGTKRFQKRIYMITDAAAPILDDPAAMEQICEGMRRDEFKLNIIGIGFQDDDEEDGVKKEEGDEDGEERKHDRPAAAAAASSSSSHVKKESMRTATQKTNEAILKRFANDVEGTVFNATNAISMLSEFRSRSVNQVTKFRGPLEIGNQNFQVWSYGKTAVQNMPTMKKMSKLDTGSSVGDEDSSAAAAGGWRGGGGGDDDEDGEGGFGGPGGGGDSGIQMERTYLNKRGEREKEVKLEQRIKSFRYGKEQVPFSEEDLEKLKLQADKGIKILSFIPQKLVPRHHYMANVDCIVAEPGDYSSALALSALIHACYDTAKVAVVRYVKRQNDRPLLGILIPVVKMDMEVFYFNQLPFEEDIREYSFSGMEDVKITPNQKQAALDLVRSMNLMTAGKDEDGDPTEALVPKYTYNPVLQRFYQAVEKRALDESAEIDELDPEIAKYIVPDATLMRQAAPKLTNFKHAFTLQPVVVEEKKKRNWKDWYSSEVTRDTDLEAVRKRLKQGEEGGAAGAAAGGAGSFDSRAASNFSLDSALAPAVDRVGPVNPIADFNTLLQRHDDVSVIKRAIDEMSARIKESITLSYMGNFYDKAIDCLRALRTGCVTHEESMKFNTLLNELKSLYAPSSSKPRQQHADFFQKMQVANLLPINDVETSTSTVTEAEAAKFYERDLSIPHAVAPVAAPVDDTDLFDSME